MGWVQAGVAAAQIGLQEGATGGRGTIGTIVRRLFGSGGSSASHEQREAAEAGRTGGAVGGFIAEIRSASSLQQLYDKMVANGSGATGGTSSLAIGTGIVIPYVDFVEEVRNGRAVYPTRAPDDRSLRAIGLVRAVGAPNAGFPNNIETLDVGVGIPGMGYPAWTPWGFFLRLANPRPGDRFYGVVNAGIAQGMLDPMNRAVHDAMMNRIVELVDADPTEFLRMTEQDDMVRHAVAAEFEIASIAARQAAQATVLDPMVSPALLPIIRGGSDATPIALRRVDPKLATTNGGGEAVGDVRMQLDPPAAEVVGSQRAATLEGQPFWNQARAFIGNTFDAMVNAGTESAVAQFRQTKTGQDLEARAKRQALIDTITQPGALLIGAAGIFGLLLLARR